MLKIITKIIILIVIVYVLQLWVVRYFPPDIGGEVRQMETALNQKKDIFYFGDSILFTTGINDTDIRTIPSMLESNLSRLSVGMVEHPANSAPVYLEYCRYLSRNKYKPKIVVIPISMRNFSLEWETNPGKQFMEERYNFKFIKTPIYPFLQFLISFKVLKLYPRTYDAFYQTPFNYKGKSLGKIGDYFGNKYKTYSDENMKKQISIYYLYQLNSTDSVLSSIKEIANQCNFAKVVFYITPVNFQLGQKFLGNDFARQVNQNIKVLKQTLSENNSTYLDLSHSLSSSAFYWQDELYMNEHLNQTGRQFVASNVAAKIKKVLKN